LQHFRRDIFPARQFFSLSVSMFRLVHTNSIVEVYAWAEPRRCTAGRPLVVVALGNTCDFAGGVTHWYESPAWGADFVICVRSAELNQAEYLMGLGDGASWMDWTESDAQHSQLVMDGVVESLKDEDPLHRTWILCGLSGGCVTAVTVGAALCGPADEVIGIVVDSGVPGSGEALQLRDVPVFVHRHTRPAERKGQPEFWSNGEVTVEWTRRGYNVVEDEAYTSPGHASFLTYSVLRECVYRLWWLHDLRLL
jgi:hypothetical protein